MKFCEEDISVLLELQKRNVWLEGNILKILEAEPESDFENYLTLAKERDRDNRRKRLDITKQIQEQNLELISQKEENERLMEEIRVALTESEESKSQIECQNRELLLWKEENERIGEELKLALSTAEDAREEAELAKRAAEDDLDLLQKRTQFELIGTIVKVALWVIVGVGLVTTSIYMIALFTGRDTQIIGSTWSNMFGILLTNAFSIIGTIMGVKYASEKHKNND
jgi:hypothetical protein